MNCHLAHERCFGHHANAQHVRRQPLVRVEQETEIRGDDLDVSAHVEQLAIGERGFRRAHQ